MLALSRTVHFTFAAFLLAVTSCVPFAAAQAQSQRVALIVGNGAYQHASSLANPPNDAVDLEQTFLRIGFDVTRVSNADRLGFLKALRAFEDKVAGADIAVIYYAGHGIEIDGSNYLIPVDAKLERDLDVEDEAVALARVLQTVREAKRLKLVLLDACRANSFENRMKRTFATRAIGRGLNNLQPAGSTVVAYSAKQGTLAEDGFGRNSPFASSLLARLEQPGLEINFLFRAVRDDVLKTTNMRQEPYTYGSLGSEKIYLNGASEPSTTDEVAWNFLDRTNIRELQRFIRQFPDSKFRAAAEVAARSADAPAPDQTNKGRYPSTGATMPNPFDACATASDHWKSSEAIKTRTAYEDHLARFSTCGFAGLARARLAALTVPEPDKLRFDGSWTGMLVCASTGAGLKSWSYALNGKVTNAVFRAERGQIGKPGSETFIGTIEPDGTATIIQKGLTGDSRKDPYRRVAGTEYGNRYFMKFVGTRGSGTRSDRPDCNVTLTKR
jgi:hypothetical protein